LQDDDNLNNSRKVTATALFLPHLCFLISLARPSQCRQVSQHHRSPCDIATIATKLRIVTSASRRDSPISTFALRRTSQRFANIPETAYSDEDASDVEVAQPVKKGPGRPRKTPKYEEPEEEEEVVSADDKNGDAGEEDEEGGEEDEEVYETPSVDLPR
jgi:hypothetical protein